MNSVHSATPVVAPQDLLQALPVETLAWVAVAVLVLAVGAYATRQRTPIVTLDTLADETNAEVQR